MSERDRDLTSLFVRDIDEIPLPPRVAWKPARSSPVGWSIFRPVALVAGTAAVLVAALVIGVALRERGVPAASPSPSAPAAAVPTVTATPGAEPTGSPAATPLAPSPSPSASPRDQVLDEDFGLLLGNFSRVNVRRETSEETLATIGGEDANFSSAQVVSPDGRFVAYWSPWQNGAVLHVAAVADGRTRTVFTAPDSLNAGAFAWSTDGTGLVVEVARVTWIGPEDPPPNVAQMWTVDLASGSTEKIAERTDGAVWVPVAWDRARNIVAAGVTGDGGYLVDYDLVDLGRQPYEVRSTPMPDPRPLAFSLDVSSDAKYVLVVGDGLSKVMWWPLAEPELRSSIDFPGSGPTGAAWRPGTHEIWWVGGLTGAGCPAHPCVGTELERFDIATETTTVVHRGEYRTTLGGFRVDGSAAITTAGDPNAQFTPAGNRTLFTFVDLASGATAEFDSDGIFVGAVRLD